ncbi:Dolichyl-phosphate beta-glucosyltransferase [Apostichopus japonicus]|uniref:Dolichyl-phosphate beta-glucosyltransferase n=1 Tax=Stichopus japonicus TaxID=307972 RepID=A0A2G8KI16_STIJA|nr:Dolichyl-phosphate beta-glucosyltransferase [Apostichopus japonicus]
MIDYRPRNVRVDRDTQFVVRNVIIFLFFTSPPPDMYRYLNEKSYADPNKDNAMVDFPSLYSPASIDLSIVVPAYNEEERLPKMLDECLEILESRRESNKGFTYEVIIVDDGSKDKTTQVGLKYSKKYTVEFVRVLTLTKNRGKGGAIRLGMLSARGRALLFADADGATEFKDLVKLEESLKKINQNQDSRALVCGSRAHLQDEAVAQRSSFRTILMYGFHFFVWFLCVRSIKDTQCGFKLMTRNAAAVLFSNMHVNRWAFDVELLYIAQYLGIPMDEVAVNWQEIEGSKIIPIFSWAQMGKDILFIRLRYTLGFWKIEDKVKGQ